MSNGLIPGTVMATVGQATTLITVAATLISTFRALRAANPTVPLPTDAELIALLEASADQVVAHADRLLARYQRPSPPI